MLKDLLEGLQTNHPCCLPEDASVLEVAQLMKKEDIGCVLVTRAGPKGGSRVPIGIITDRDLAMRLLADGLDPKQARAREIMTPSPRVVSENAGLYECISAMHDGGIRRIPVVDASGNAVGILSFGDVLRLLSREFESLVSGNTRPSTQTTGHEIMQKKTEKQAKIA